MIRATSGPRLVPRYPPHSRGPLNLFADDADESSTGIIRPGFVSDSKFGSAIRERSPKILVVDDEDLFRAGLAYQLREEYDAEVEEAGTGAEALLQADSGFDLILMDINMPPGMDGLETCAKLRRRALALQVVLMTADANAERRQRAEGMGVTLLGKPLDFEILERILLGCLEGSHS